MESKVERKLYETFAKLSEKTDDKISVSYLCEKADVSRAGFYIYYKDIEDFEDKCKEYITEKLFAQALIILENTDYAHEYEMLFNESDVSLLKAFTGKHDYWSFAEIANSVVAPNFIGLIKERFGQEYYENNKTVLEFILNGCIASIYFSLLDFNVSKFKRDVNYMKNIARELLPD